MFRKVLLFFILVIIQTKCSKNFDYNDKSGPLYCTEIHFVTTKAKGPDSFLKYIYPLTYIIPKQKMAFKRLWCYSPVETFIRVCDWKQPPLVDLCMQQTFITIIRQDRGANRFLGNAIINITQRCVDERMNLNHQVHIKSQKMERIRNIKRDPWHKQESLNSKYSERIKLYNRTNHTSCCWRDWLWDSRGAPED